MQDAGGRVVRLSDLLASDTASQPASAFKAIDTDQKIELKKLALDRAKLKIERDKLNFEVRKFDNEAHHRRATQTNQYATIAIRNVVLINGAAAVTTLTYLGNIAKNGSLTVTASAVDGSSAFVMGVFTASMCTILAYGARATYKGTGNKPIFSIGLELLSWICGLIALFCFPIGAYNISKAIDAFGTSVDRSRFPTVMQMQIEGRSPDLCGYILSDPTLGAARLRPEEHQRQTP